MKELDRSRPMRAVHRETGEVADVSTVDQSKALRIGGMTAYFDRYGNPKDDFCPWRVENVPTCTEAVMELGPISPDTITAAINERVKQYAATVATKTVEVDKALWERVVWLVRDMSEVMTASHYDEARAIAKLLQPVVDTDDDAAVKLVDSMIDDGYIFANGKQAIEIANRAIKRGRALERGE